MREVCRVSPGSILPDRDGVLGRTGMAPRAEPAPGVARLVERALALPGRHARPVAVFEEIPTSEFARVLEGEGGNLSPNPVEEIHPKAERAGLFALTLGREVQDEIGALVETGEFPLGYLLDAAASAAAESFARAVAARFLEALVAGGAAAPDRTALDYSPGYCGWHVTGQRRLFERLAPGEIGISLNESCLMDPLKSVSGAILVGPAEIHRFEAAYPCCAACSDRDCRERSGRPVALRPA